MQTQSYSILMREGTALPTSDLQARAKALEQAMQEANAIAEDLRIDIERQQEVLAECEKRRKAVELAIVITKPEAEAEAIASVVYGKQEADYQRGIRAGLSLSDFFFTPWVC